MNNGYKNFRPVTDPELLARLNSNTSSSGNGSYKNFRPVTDPELLARLNRNQNQEEITPQKKGTFLGGIGTSLVNMPFDIAELPIQALKGGATLINKGLNKIPGVNIPYPDLNNRVMPQINAPENPSSAYKVGSFVGSALPFMVQPELAAGKLSLGSGIVPKIAKAGYKGIIESSPKIASSLGEYLRINPGKISNKIAQVAEESLGKSKSINKEVYSMIEEKVGAHELPIFSKTAKNIEDLQTTGIKPEVKEIAKKFLENPTYTKANSFQKILYRGAKDLREKINLKGGDEAARLRVEILDKTRSEVIDNMDNLLKNFDKLNGTNLSKLREAANLRHINEVIPGKNAVEIVKASRLDGKMLTEKLLKKMSNASTDLELERNPLPKEFKSLRKELESRSNRLGRAKKMAIGAAVVSGGPLAYKLRHLLGY